LWKVYQGIVLIHGDDVLSTGSVRLGQWLSGGDGRSDVSNWKLPAFVWMVWLNTYDPPSEHNATAIDKNRWLSGSAGGDGIYLFNLRWVWAAANHGGPGAIPSIGDSSWQAPNTKDHARLSIQIKDQGPSRLAAYSVPGS
jgi:hypothetical protein